MIGWRLACCALVVASAAVAAADPAAPEPTIEAVITPPEAVHHDTARVLYLNRCVGGCTITKSGVDDARTHLSTLPDGPGTDYVVTEFAGDDTEWGQIVQCMKEVYSPFAIEVTDVRPTNGLAYNEAIIAGSDTDIGVSAGGIAPITQDCNPYSYVISYSFANDFPTTGRAIKMCSVAAQESGHAYGLDHAYTLSDGSSACRDPMSYRVDCGGQRFFRNDQSTCGEYGPRQCRCGATQNSHLKLLSVLGAGTPITTPPELTVSSPTEGATIAAGSSVSAIASAQRGVDEVELWLNDYKWTTVKGVGFGPAGQPAASYVLPILAQVPDGVIDIVVKAKDDIDATTTAPTITVTKGAACTSAATCLEGQICDERGRCLWEPPVGQVGDACTYPQFCVSGQCEGTNEGKICTQTCVPGVEDSCPMGFTCLDQAVCWPAKEESGGGCCSASRSLPSQAALSAFALGMLGFRRRRRR